MHPNHVNKINEEDIILFFERWVIRVQEQGLISALRPSLNKDNVKFQLQWEPVNIPLLTSEGKIESKPHIIVHKAGTSEVLITENKYRRLASYLGITRYNDGKIKQL